MIEINNLTTIKVNEERLKKAAQLVLAGEGAKQEVGLSIAFIGSGRMRKLNKKYRRKNRVTDVLAFPESEVTFEKFKIGPLKETKSLGEILICPREAKKNAKRLNSTFEKELITCLIHGVLHLLGYEDERGEEQARKMENKQESYLLQALKSPPKKF